MADLIVTLCKGRSLKTLGENKTNYPVPDANTARSFAILVDTVSTTGGFTVDDGEDYAVLYCDSACWVAFDAAAEPLAVPALSIDSPPYQPRDSFFIAAGGYREFHVSAGMQIAVVSA